ncbi:MAG: hypothetical protein JW841_08030 [Deltaproteobacteria bacterium]|nr:hypothetical protein [Deltaproteobacteria bacterium]
MKSKQAGFLGEWRFITLLWLFVALAVFVTGIAVKSCLYNAKQSTFHDQDNLPSESK